MYCPNCGKQVDDDETFCKYCSFRLDNVYGPNDSRVHVEDPRGGSNNSDFLAYFLSAVFPGTGAVYADSSMFGIIVFLLSLGAMITTLLIPALALFTIPVMVLLWIGGMSITKAALTRKKYRR